MQHTSTQDVSTSQQPTMDPETMTATTPFRLLDLPQELRDDIYEAAIFDLSPPEIFISPTWATDFPYRNMDTNILLTNRKIYWEALDVILRRGQLVMVFATRLHSGICRDPRPLVHILTGWTGITVINPKYRNLCIMNHQINAARSARRSNLREGKQELEFIVHQRDIKSFCQALVGKFNYNTESILGPRATHTLMLHCPPSYAQHECMSFYWAQTRILQEYRTIFRGFEDVSILGNSNGWESGLYQATLKDIRSTNGKFTGGFIDDIRNLEKEGLDTFSQTGDFEAADASWVKALGVCQVARQSFTYSHISLPKYYERTSVEYNAAWWDPLRRENGNACAIPIVEIWYRLNSIRLSAVLRLIQRGDHLATKHGRAPKPVKYFVTFVKIRYTESNSLARRFFMLDDGWLPPPSEEARTCFTVAAAYRLLDASHEAPMAARAIYRAVELAPDDEKVEQERVHIDTWIAGLLDQGRYHVRMSERA